MHLPRLLLKHTSNRHSTEDGVAYRSVFSHSN